MHDSKSEQVPARRRWRLWLFLLVAIAILIPCTFLLMTIPARYSSFDSLPNRTVAIVLGARVYDDGTPSPMLKDRLDASIALYNAGKVKVLLFTGDNGRKEYDEVTAMKEYALSQGVFEGSIKLDYAGFSTYDSCYRAKAIFGVESAIVVTQKFHVPRAVMLCRRMGIEAVGYSLPDIAKYPDQKMLYIREVAAQYAAFPAWIFKPKPAILGDPESPLSDPSL